MPLPAADNPFRNDRVYRLEYRLVGAGWDDLLQKLQALNYRAAVVGSYGSGKTAFLHTLQFRLEQQNVSSILHRVAAGRHIWQPPPALRQIISEVGPDDLLLLDEANLLLGPAWWQVRRQTEGKGGCVIATHRTGRLPTLWRCRTSVELLQELVRELVNGRSTPSTRLLTTLFRQHRGNLRAIFADLYDLYADANDDIESA